MNNFDRNDFYVCLVITAIFITTNAIRNVTRKVNELVSLDPDTCDADAAAAALDFKVGCQAKPASYVEASDDTNTVMTS